MNVSSTFAVWPFFTLMRWTDPEEAEASTFSDVACQAVQCKDDCV